VSINDKLGDDGPTRGPQRNEGDETRVNVLLKRVGQTRVIGTIRSVEYGMFGERWASLIRLNFILRAPMGDTFHWTQGQVWVTFKYQNANNTPKQYPEIIRYGPRKYFDALSTVSHESHFEIELSASGGPGIAQVGVGAKLGASKSYEKTA
jgi:hypothetical protein